MKNKIVISFKPFTLFHKINVINEKGDILESVDATVANYPTLTKGLIEKFNVSEVILYGCQGYLEKFKNELITNFDNQNIDIKIIDN